MQSFFWYDYETFGTDPQRDYPAQFAGIRTTMELDVIDQPVMFFCRPSRDSLPSPDACLITGITPQQAEREGVNEMTFAARVHAQLAVPETCTVGYNSLRFDDEITRHLLYRNFYDPYAREWEHGNSRWDLLDLARLCEALRPEGIVWPCREDGLPSFKLADLSHANGLNQERAHDALSDVHALIDLGRLMRRHQPKLWNWYFRLRRKEFVFEQFDLERMTPLVHVSRRYPAHRHCLAVIAPLAKHPQRNNEMIIYDLAVDPADLLTLDEDAIADRVFTARVDLPEGVERIPLRTIRVNRSPALAPVSVVSSREVQERLGLDLASQLAHCDALRGGGSALIRKVKHVYAAFGMRSQPRDPELALYTRFLSEVDKRLLTRVREMAPAGLAQHRFYFQDPRYEELLFRYRARNWPQSLNEAEYACWQDFRHRRLTRRTPLTTLTLEDYFTRLAVLRAQTCASQQPLLDQLQVWGQQLGADLSDKSQGRLDRSSCPLSMGSSSH